MQVRSAPLCPLLIFGLLAAPSEAAEWSFEPAVNLRAEYNDNFELSAEDRISVWGAVLSPSAKFRGATEALAVTGALALSFARYPGHPEFDVTKYALAVLSTYTTERDVVGLDVFARRDASTQSELAATGLVLEYRITNSLTASPYWTRSITENTSVTARYSHDDVDYDDPDSSGVSGYLNRRASVGAHTRIDERRTASVEAFYARYEPRPSSTRQSSYGLSAAYDHAFSETLSGRVGLGWRWTESVFSAQTTVCEGVVPSGTCDVKDSGGILNAALSWRSATDTLTGQISQDLYGSGVGSVVQTRRVGAAWTRQWTDALAATFDAFAYKTEPIGETATASSESSTFQFNSRLSWRLSEEWVLNAGYQFTRLKVQTEPRPANGNLVYVEVGYVGRNLTMSR